MSRIDRELKIIAVVCFSLLLWIGCASAATVVVSKTSPACSSGDEYYTSIQAAVDSANDGDEIVVCPGTYVENILVDKSLKIRSMNGSDSTIVQAKKPDKDVFEVTVDYVGISGFTVNGAKRWLASGIHLHYADYCNISNNNCSNNNNGICAQYSSNNIIIDNICYNNAKGILLLYSNNNRISNNICTNNRTDIFLRDSKNNKLNGNDMVENGILIEGDTLSDYTHEIDESNTVNGKTVYYWKDREGGKVPDDAGQCILVNCSHIDVKNQNLSNATVGMEVVYSSHIAIFNNTCSNNREAGIMLMNSRNTTIEKNIVSNNGFGIYLNSSFNNIIRDNNILNNRFGIYLAYYSFNNTIGHNVAKSNYWDGFALYSSSDHNTIEDNIASNNGDGITVSESDNNIIKNNTACENEYCGVNFAFSSYGTINNNTCSNNRDAGIMLMNSSNTTIEKNIVFDIRNSEAAGIYLEYADGCNLSENNIYSTSDGIHLFSSNNSKICYNTVNSNYFTGIRLRFSNDNLIANNIANSNKNLLGVPGYGLMLIGSNNNTVIDNNVSKNMKGGISLFYSSNNIIKGNTANSNEEDGIELFFFSDNNRVIENSASDNYAGINIVGSSNSIIRGNNVSDNLAGIRLDSLLNFTSLNNSIINNNASNNMKTGIALNDSDNNIIKDNTVTSNKQLQGIMLMSSNNNDIIANNASNNMQAGIFLLDSSNNNIKDNTANSNNYYGMYQEKSNNNDIIDNIFSNNVQSGVWLDHSNNNSIKGNIPNSNSYGFSLTFSDNNNIIENNVSNNTQDGISLHSSRYNSIKGNTVIHNYHGIAVSFLSYGNDVTNNFIYLNYGGGIIIESVSFTNNISHNIINSNAVYGLHLADGSVDNNIESNIINSNKGNGLSIQSSENNTVLNNVIDFNRENGISFYDASSIIIAGNTISTNYCAGIAFSRTNNSHNKIYHNNIINNIANSKLNNWWYDLLRKEGNYWSNYDGVDDGSGTGKHCIAGDGIGDTDIPHPGAGGDYYPFMNRDGWLTMSLWPNYFDFERVYQGILINQTFTITNYANSILHVSSIKCDSPITISGIKLPADIPEGEKRCFNLTLDTEKEEGVVHKIIEILSNDPQYPRKNITIFGFVEIPTSNIKIKRIDFPLRGFIKGQIGLLNITIENRGDFREKNVSIEIKEGDKTRDSTMIAIIDPEEAKSAIVKWNTNNVSLGIHDITIEVLNKDQKALANITVTVTVLAPSQAKTLIATNHERLEGIEDNLIRLSHHPSVNGIILDVGKDKRCSEAYKSFDSYHNSENANNIAQAIKDLIDATREVYKNIEYLLIVGNDEVVPFYRIQDKSLESYVGSYGLYDEKDYIETYEQLKRTTSVGSAFDENRFLTDDFYASFDSEDLPKGFEGELYIPDIPVGRLVETPEEIRKTIAVFTKKGDIVEPLRVFITSYDFMNDAGGSCASVWGALSPPVFMGKGIEEHGTYTDTAEIINELLNESNNIVAIFQHADHSGFDIAESHDFVTSNIISNSSADLNGSIVYTMSCHAGLNVPKDEKFNYDLAQAFMGKGVLAYVAPTGWGIGGVVTEAGHERLMHYFTKHLCDGMDAGTALMHAKQDYYAFDFDFDYIDQKVVLTTVLYGLPMYGVNVEAKTERLMKAMSMEKPCNTFTFRPDYSEIETPVGNYSSVDETLSSPGKPVLPKLIWPYLMDGKMLHGITLKNARYALIENTALPYEEYVVSLAGGYKQPLLTGETWNPSEFFKVSTIGKRQYIILITGQFKKTGWTLKEGQKVNIGDLRRYSELTFDLHLSTPADEKNPPEITVSYVNASCISVNATDESGIEKLVMAYTDNTGNWASFDIVPDVAACTLEEEIELEVGKEYFVQAVDIYGNVAVDDNGGRYYPKKVVGLDDELN